MANRLPLEVRELAITIRCNRFEFGDLGPEAIQHVDRPLTLTMAEQGYRHAEQIKLFGPTGGTPREAVNEAARRFLPAKPEERRPDPGRVR